MKPLTILILLLLPVLGHSQSEVVVDSLLQLLETSIAPQEKVDAYNLLAYEYRRADSAKTAFYAEKAIYLANEIQYEKGIVEAYYAIGLATWRANDYSKAIELYQYQLSVAKKIAYQKGMSDAFNGLGLIYLSEGYYPKALEYEFQSLQIKEALGDDAGIAQALSYIGLCYYGQEDYGKSLEYYFKSLKVKERIGIAYQQYGADGKSLVNTFQSLSAQDQRGLAINFNNIGEVYAKQKDYAHALTYYFKSLDILEVSGIGAHNFLPYILLSVGSGYTELAIYDSAANYLNRALAISINEKDQLLTGLSYTDLGQLRLKERKYSQAVTYFQKAMDIATAIDNIESVKSAAEGLHQAYGAVGKYEVAYQAHQTYKKVSDSLKNEANTEEVARLGFQRVQELKDRERELIQAKKDAAVEQELKQHQYLLYIFSGGLLFLLIIVAVVYKNYRDKQRSNAILAKQNIEITQLYDQTESLLLNILPEETAKELKASGHATTKSYQKVSVLFTDFKGFTMLAEKMSAEELVENLDYCFRAFDKICKKHGLEKIKTIGDAYMAAGGIPKADDDNPQRCVDAALEIRAFMDSWKQAKETKGEEAWQVRIGIHTGPVVAGVVGEDKFAYDIWGDTVNLASRMESSGEPGKVNISEATYAAIAGLELHPTAPNQNIAAPSYYQFHYRGKINAKNKGEVGMYFVER